MDPLKKVASAEAALPGEVREGSQEEVSIQEPFDKRETQGPVPIREGASIRKMGLRNQKSKVMGQRSLYFWRKGIIQRGLALLKE